MKRLPLKLWIVGIAVSGLVSQTATAQLPPNRGASLLQTQPASIGQPTGQLRPMSYNQSDLNGISASLQARPPRSSEAIVIPGIPSSVVDSNLPAPQSSTVNPLDFFKVPAPPNGIRVKVRDTP